MRRRVDAAHLVGQQRPEGRPRFDPGVPVPAFFRFLPWHLAHEIGDRQRRAGGKVGIGQPVAGQPAPRFHQMIDIAQMHADIGTRRAQQVGIGCTVASRSGPFALDDLLLHQKSRYLCVELHDKPFRQPPHFSPLIGIGRQQPVLGQREAARFVEIFRYRPGAADRRTVVFHQHRQGGGRVHDQKILAALPEPLLDKFWRDLAFRQHQPGETRRNRQRMMKKPDHGPPTFVAAGFCHSLAGRIMVSTLPN